MIEYFPAAAGRFLSFVNNFYSFYLRSHFFHTHFNHMGKKDPEDEDLLFRGELFSVTPESEQLCWVRDCTYDYEIPSTQSIISSWMKWLNQA